MTNIILREVTSLTISGKLILVSFHPHPLFENWSLARITCSFPSRSIADPLKNLSDACCSVWPPSAIDDGLVCYGFRRAQVGRADTRDYLLCGQIGSFRTRQRGPLSVWTGIDPPREYNSDPTGDTPLRYNLQFCINGHPRGEGGRNPMIG